MKETFSTTDLLQAITQIQSQFIADVEPKELFDRLLDSLLILTNSEYGFIGEIHHKPDGTPYLKTHAITNIAWNQETADFYEKNAPNGLEFHNLKSLFGKVITSGKPVIANHPATDPRRSGIPMGHPPLKSFLGLPFHYNGRLTGMVGIANRPQSYNEPIVQYLQPLLTTCANIMEAYHIDRQRQHTEDLLRKSEARTSAVVSTAMSGIVVINAKGIIELFNPAAERIFGYTEQEIIGRNVNLLMPEPYCYEHDDYIAHYLKTGERKIIGIGRETIAKRKNGIIFPVELAVNEMREKNESKFVGVIIDITERKRTEQMLIHAKEQAEESNRLKSVFLNTISHELKTPLTVILGNVPLLTNSAQLPTPEDIVEIAKDVEESGKQLLNLINDLLDISKIEAGKMVLHRRLLSTRTLLAEVMINIQDKAKNKNLTVKTFSENIYIFADPFRLKQILLNLLGNAIKFTTEGTIIAKVTQTDNMIHFNVEDTGCGIGEEDIPFIFDAFHQIDSGATRRSEGTGLGLAITKKLIELHGGNIMVQSKIGIFVFYS